MLLAAGVPGSPLRPRRLLALQEMMRNSLQLCLLVQRTPEAAAPQPLVVAVPRPAGTFLVGVQRANGSERWGIRICSDPPYDAAATRHIFSAEVVGSPLWAHNELTGRTYPADMVQRGDVLLSAGVPGAAGEARELRHL